MSASDNFKRGKGWVQRLVRRFYYRLFFRKAIANLLISFLNLEAAGVAATKSLQSVIDEISRSRKRSEDSD